MTVFNNVTYLMLMLPGQQRGALPGVTYLHEVIFYNPTFTYDTSLPTHVPLVVSDVVFEKSSFCKILLSSES